MNYKSNPAHTGLAARRDMPSYPSSYDPAKPVSVDELLSRLRQTRPFLDMPERRLHTVIVAIAEALQPGERIDVSVLESEERPLRRWDDEGGAGGWS